MTRAKIVAGNWKMHMDLEEGKALTSEILKQLPDGGSTIILGTPFIHLATIAPMLTSHNNVVVAAQNCHQEASGAYTGEISAAMIASTGAKAVILGHSERRSYFAESDEMIYNKTKAALSQGLQPIVCVGESLELREAGEHLSFVATQLKKSLFGLSGSDFDKVVIAYEPVWAIGTGKTASPEQAQEMHAHIRKVVAEAYDSETGDKVSILYGGSVKPSNAVEIFGKPDVDGGLIGGASLNADDFIAIVKALS